LLNLHRLQALQYLAHFVVAGDIHVAGVVAIGQGAEGFDHRGDRARHAQDQGAGNEDAGDQSQHTGQDHPQAGIGE
jgi:hypothetical protein